MNNVMKIYFNPIFIVIFFIGSALLFLSIYLELPNLWKTFFHVVGIALIAVALTDPISKFFQFETLSKHIDLIQGAHKSGIIQIFSSRGDDKNFEPRMEEEIALTSEIRFIGIAFSGVFHAGLPQLVREKIHNPNVSLYILLLDPKGQNAQEREKIEVDRNTIPDIKRTLDQLKIILKIRCDKANINITGSNVNWSNVTAQIKMEVHIYDLPPIAYVIMTDNCLFLEQYHFGRLQTDVRGECIGGKIPIIQYSSYSETYKRLKAHFDYIWKNKSKNITIDLLQGKYS